MPRFHSNRWWTFILTLGVLLAACQLHASKTHAAVIRSENVPGIISDPGSGTPPPTGSGDPDVPVATSMKRWRGGGSLGSGNAYLAMRAAGDGHYVGVSNVWMWRLSVLAQAMRVYWTR